MNLRQPLSRYGRGWIVGLIAALVLSGCNRPTGAGGPQAWIDAPQHNSTHPLAPMEIVLHAADPGGVAEVELSINGEVLSRKPPQDTGAALTMMKVQWDPLVAGDYVLSARAQNHGGAWGTSMTTKITLTGAQPRVGITPVRLNTATPTPATRVVLTPTWTPTPACVDRAGFVADIRIPDNTVIDPGGTFVKVWRLRNDGNCPWTEDYQVIFSDGDPMGNNTPLPIPDVVQPGGTVDIAVNMVAPSAEGTYRGNYLIRNPQGLLFGVGSSGRTPFYVQIVVASPSGPTPTIPPRPAPDTQAPSVSVSHSPSGSSLPTGSMITFTANASDNVGVTRIDIWVTAPAQFPVLVRTCNNTTSCSYTGGPYNTQGNLSYFAIAADAAGHETNSGGHTIVIYVVVAWTREGAESQ
jgi:Ig-like domain from next to BRCA1 gene/Bacterial Ig domain